MDKPNVVVYYHAPCHDGFLAQLVIARLLHEFANVVTIPLGHGPKRTWDMNVYNDISDALVMFVDIAPHQAMLDELVNHTNITEVQVWDHHIDYFNAYATGNPWKDVYLSNYFNVTLSIKSDHPKVKLHFCNDISGSKLAPIAAGWFLMNQNNEDAIFEAAQMFNHPIVQHASDYDTWQKKLPHTDAVFAYYRNYSYDDVDKWHQLLDRITSFDTSGYRDIVNKGEAMIEAIESLAAKLCEGDTPQELELEVAGERFHGVIMNAYGLLANDTGHYMISTKGYDFAVMFNVEPTNISISIRSRPGCPANEIAKLWGGGGHAGSAGAGISGDARYDWLNTYVFNNKSDL